MLRAFFVLSFAESRKLICQNGIRRTQNLDGIKCSVSSAGLSDGKSCDRDAFRHLNDGIQRILALQVAARDGNTADGSVVLAASMPGR